MNKILLIALIFATVLSSCSNNGNKAETQDAQEVQVVENDATSTFNLISAESSVGWRATHFGGANPRYGKISLKNAEFLVNNNQLTNATVVMDMGTFTVESFPPGDEQIGKLTGHLQSPDFFDIAQFPTSKFELVSIDNADGEFTSKVTGNLTIKGVTKSITFAANVSVSDSEVTIKSEQFSVNRTDWDLKYNVEGTAGVPLDYIISNDIGFSIDVAVSK